jgi:hypothetical protein
MNSNGSSRKRRDAAKKTTAMPACLAVPVSRVPVFPGFTYGKMRGFCGDNALATSEIYRIERTDCEHGIHWKWNKEVFFTQAGVELIADRLAALGFTAESLAILVALKSALEEIHAALPLSGESKTQDYWWNNL